MPVAHHGTFQYYAAREAGSPCPGRGPCRWAGRANASINRSELIETRTEDGKRRQIRGVSDLSATGPPRRLIKPGRAEGGTADMHTCGTQHAGRLHNDSLCVSQACGSPTA